MKNLKFLNLKVAVLVLICVSTSAYCQKKKGGISKKSEFVQSALVHSLIPKRNKLNISIIMIPGHNLSSYIYLTTPDGRKGWATLMAEKGYDVYVVNNPNYDFAKTDFNVNQFTAPNDGRPPLDPESKKAWQRDIWKRWGFGAKEGQPYPDSQFPTDNFDVFDANYPYVSKAGRDYSNAVNTLIESIEGDIYMMGHSAGGPTCLTVSKSNPQQVKGMILIEPTGPPTSNDFPTLSGMNFLGVYGDYIESRNQSSRKIATEAAAELFAQHGGQANMISLPEDYGVFGNSHIMMQAYNNEFIVDLIMDWLQPLKSSQETNNEYFNELNSILIQNNLIQQGNPLLINIQDEFAFVTVIDYSGVIIKAQKLKPGTNEITNLKAGSYIIQVRSENTNISQKVVITN
ncbi:MAG: T9SS type A sorting domain-containing protein [Bacteroidales bacterium]|nr:T9SS type A sorting domain-containing protein [Bacteroidales bacterium]